MSDTCSPGTEYEHAGTWECEACGETFEVESKLDPLTHAFTCGVPSSSSGFGEGHDGYRRRKKELERYRDRVCEVHQSEVSA